MVYAGSRDGTLYALDADSGTLVWKFETGDRIRAAAAVMDGLVYINSFDRHLYAVDVETGETRWKFKTNGRLWSSPVVTHSTVYIGSADDHVYALNAKSGDLRWQYETGGSILRTPVLAGDTVYLASQDDHIYAVDATTGALRWKSELGAAPSSDLEVANGLVYVGSFDDRVYALNAKTGALRWNYWTGGNVASSPAVDSGMVYVGSDDAYLYALDAQRGTMRWSFRTRGRVASSPTVAERIVYVGSHDDYLYAIDADTGALVWKYKTDGNVPVAPAVAGNTVFVGSHDHALYAVTAGLPPGYEPSAAASATPVAGFTPLAPGELKALLDAFLSGASNDEQGTSTEQAVGEDVVSVFETGYYLLTGVSPKDEGLVPRVLSRDQYLQFVDEKRRGDPVLEAAAAFCCNRTQDRIELIINGATPVHTVISSLAHEAGHARQVIINPVQNNYPRATNVGAVREAEATAFEAALIRVLGDSAGVNATLLPIEANAQLAIEEWLARIGDQINDHTEEHLRGRILLWLAVLHDPLFAEMKEELAERGILSPGSLLVMHNRLVELVPAKIDSYVEELLAQFQTDQNLIKTSLLSRVADVPFEGFVKHAQAALFAP